MDIKAEYENTGRDIFESMKELNEIIPKQVSTDPNLMELQRALSLLQTAFTTAMYKKQLEKLL